ncbi:MAG: hypothetical protein AB1Z51_04655 [Desulfuromonadales bacterium]
MTDAKIKVQVEGNQILEVVVSDKTVDAIWIVLGEGVHNVKCKLTPTRNSLAYAGSVMGREIIYHRSVAKVKEDIARKEHESVQFRTR